MPATPGAFAVWGLGEPRVRVYVIVSCLCVSAFIDEVSPPLLKCVLLFVGLMLEVLPCGVRTAVQQLVDLSCLFDFFSPLGLF